MSSPGDVKGPRDPAEEPFLARWSRRKRQAREGIEEGAAEPVEAESAPAGSAPAEPAPAEPQALPELPDIESLGEESDYSAFMASGVDESLRRKALRKLFSSPKFNVLDGMDDYCEDFTRWAPLGDVVTADMRHHLERAAKLAEQLAETDAARDEPVPAPQSRAAVAAEAPTQGAPETEDPTEEPECDA